MVEIWRRGYKHCIECDECRLRVIRERASYNPDNHFCSNKCAVKFKTKARIVECTTCSKEFTRIPARIKKVNFCSNKCWQTYRKRKQ